MKLMVDETQVMREKISRMTLQILDRLDYLLTQETGIKKAED